MYINDGWNSGRTNAASVLGLFVVSSELHPSKGVWRELCDVVVCWPVIGGTLLAVVIVGVPVIWSEGKLGKTLGKFSTKASSVAHLGLLSCMLTQGHFPFWSMLCGDLSGFAGVEAAVWFRPSVEERVEVASLLRLTSWVHPGTKTDGQTPSHKGQWEAKKQLTYLVYVLLLKPSPQFVFPLITCLVAFGHLKILVRVSWAQEYQSLLGFSSANRTHRVHMKTSAKRTQCLQIIVPCPAEVKQVKTDALLTCDSLPWCYVMLFSCVVIPVATTTIIWHIILPDACLSCAVLALAGFTPAE